MSTILPTDQEQLQAALNRLLNHREAKHHDNDALFREIYDCSLCGVLETRLLRLQLLAAR